MDDVYGDTQQQFQIQLNRITSETMGSSYIQIQSQMKLESESNVHDTGYLKRLTGGGVHEQHYIIQLKGELVSLGQAEFNDVVLIAPNISYPQHCVLKYLKQTKNWAIQATSSQDVFIAGRKVSKTQFTVLTHGDLITLTSSPELIYQYQAKTGGSSSIDSGFPQHGYLKSQVMEQSGQSMVTAKKLETSGSHSSVSGSSIALSLAMLTPVQVPDSEVSKSLAIPSPHVQNLTQKLQNLDSEIITMRENFTLEMTQLKTQLKAVQDDHSKLQIQYQAMIDEQKLEFPNHTRAGSAIKFNVQSQHQDAAVQTLEVRESLRDGAQEHHFQSQSNDMFLSPRTRGGITEETTAICDNDLNSRRCSNQDPFMVIDDQDAQPNNNYARFSGRSNGSSRYSSVSSPHLGKPLMYQNMFVNHPTTFNENNCRLRGGYTPNITTMIHEQQYPPPQRYFPLERNITDELTTSPPNATEMLPRPMSKSYSQAFKLISKHLEGNSKDTEATSGCAWRSSSTQRRRAYSSVSSEGNEEDSAFLRQSSSGSGGAEERVSEDADLI